MEESNENEFRKLYNLEFFCLSGVRLPKEVENRLIGYCVDFFTSQLFKVKHLPNGVRGPLVNSEVSVLRDLRAYLYIADDPISEEYSISRIEFQRCKQTQALTSIRLYVSSPEVVAVKLLPSVVEEDIPTGFRDMNGDPIPGGAVVKYEDQVFQVIMNPFTHRWVLDNENGQVDLLLCYREVSLINGDEENSNGD